MRIKQLRKLILETVKEEQRTQRLAKAIYEARLVLEEADPSKMDPKMFPQDLSDVAKSPDVAASLSKGGRPELDDGDPDDDVIPYEDKVNIASVQKLKPSQTSMNIKKAMAFALGHIKSGSPGGHLGAFVSSDMFIMDGHHRWISSGMVDPDATIGGYLVDFPGQQLVAVLNNLTVGRFGRLEGKEATGGFEQFKEGPIRNQLEDYLANGAGAVKDKETGEPNPYRLEPEDVQSLIEKFTEKTGEEAKEEAITKFVDNLSKLTMNVPAWASGREEMPVIEKNNSEEARNALAQGEIDVNPPYSLSMLPDDHTNPEKSEAEQQNSNYNRGDSVILERWHKLAGLLKD